LAETGHRAERPCPANGAAERNAFVMFAAGDHLVTPLGLGMPGDPFGPTKAVARLCNTRRRKNRDESRHRRVPQPASRTDRATGVGRYSMPRQD